MSVLGAPPSCQHAVLLACFLKFCSLKCGFSFFFFHAMQLAGSYSLTRDQTQAHNSESMEFYPLDYQGIPLSFIRSFSKAHWVGSVGQELSWLGKYKKQDNDPTGMELPVSWARVLYLGQCCPQGTWHLVMTGVLWLFHLEECYWHLERSQGCC